MGQWRRTSHPHTYRWVSLWTGTRLKALFLEKMIWIRWSFWVFKLSAVCIQARCLWMTPSTSANISPTCVWMDAASRRRQATAASATWATNRTFVGSVSVRNGLTHTMCVHAVISEAHRQTLRLCDSPTFNHMRCTAIFCQFKELDTSVGRCWQEKSAHI